MGELMEQLRETIERSIQAQTVPGQPSLTEEQIAKRVAKYYEEQFHRPYCTRCHGEGTISHTVMIPEEDSTSPWGPSKTVFNMGKCPDCGGAQDNEERLRLIITASGINPAWQKSYTFDTYNPDVQPAMLPVFRQVVAWADRPAHSLVLSGGTGVGKTHLAIASALTCAKNGLYVRFAETATLLDKLRNATRDGRYEQVWAGWVEEPNVLVLDDLKAEHQTEYGAATLDQAIAWRLLNERPMLITTNAGPNQLSERMSSRFLDRSLCSLLVCDGADIRPVQVQR
jgi:DNA replication protein DnaC